jgi:protein-S-isoprenylcysteine O-methyltransferase Ste14
VSLWGWITLGWAVFWIYWLVEAVRSKPGGGGGISGRPVGTVIVIAGIILIPRLHLHGLNVHAPVLRAIGVALFVAGLALAVWARINIGRNWGMPMTTKAEPELVTSGPYAVVRHPIYSGILLAFLGTALATNISWLLALVVGGAYFIYSATVEEKIMGTTFPDVYPSYRARTKMLIPFLL